MPSPHFILTHSTSKNTLQGKISSTLHSKTSEIQGQITHKYHFQGNFSRIYIVTLFLASTSYSCLYGPTLPNMFLLRFMFFVIGIYVGNRLTLMLHCVIFRLFELFLLERRTLGWNLGVSSMDMLICEIGYI